MSAEVVIPDKDEFRIGEVCDIAGVKPFVLRYWETEFPDLQPAKGSGGQRTYSRADVELILRIKHLLYEERFTVAGAKKRLAEEASQGAVRAVAVAPRLDSTAREEVERLRRALAEVKRELEIVIALLR
ncbi:MAG: MerR family transcriptional regulator [Acidobacteriota bacterium]|jgi:DNA-binding transcriptional MerR regulator